MTPEETITLSLSVKTKQLELARQRVAEAKHIFVDVQSRLLAAKKAMFDYHELRPELYKTLFASIQGRSLHFVELDTYFAELDQVADRELELENSISEAESWFEIANTRLSAEMASLSQAQKKHEKMKEMKKLYTNQSKKDAILKEENDFDETAQTLEASKSIFSVANK